MSSSKDKQNRTASASTPGSSLPASKIFRTPLPNSSPRARWFIDRFGDDISLIPDQRTFEIGGTEITVNGAAIQGKGSVYIEDEILTGEDDNEFLKLVVEAVRENPNITPRELVKEIDLEHRGPGKRYVQRLVDEEESLGVAKEDKDDGDMESEENYDEEIAVEEIAIEEINPEKTVDEKMEDMGDTSVEGDSAWRRAAPANGDNTNMPETNTNLTPATQTKPKLRRKRKYHSLK